MIRRTHFRRLHRSLVPLAALPLLLTSLSGSIYGALSARGIDAFWLMKLHTGNFGVVNLQPYYSTVLGILTLFIAGSGVGLLLSLHQNSKRSPPSV